MLTDIETHKIFYDKLRFVYLEMPKFTKELDELETRFDKWMYVLKNLKWLDNIPDKLREKIFDKIFAAAEIAKLCKEEYEQYIVSLNAYRDLKNSLDTAKDEKAIEIALKMLEDKMPIDIIEKYTALSREKIEKLKK
jgi:hypothetical protein